MDVRKNLSIQRVERGTAGDKADHARPPVQEGVQEAHGDPVASRLDESKFKTQPRMRHGYREMTFFKRAYLAHEELQHHTTA